MKKKFISVVLSFSLVFGTIFANAVSVSFDEIEFIETESNIFFEDLEQGDKTLDIETEKTVSNKELTNTDSDIYYDEIDSSEATEGQKENDSAKPALFSDKTNQEVQVSVTNKPVVDVMLASKETNINLDNFEADLRIAIKNLGIDDSLFNFVTVERTYTEFDQNGYTAQEIYNSWQMIPNPNACIVINDMIVNDMGQTTSSPYAGHKQSFVYTETYDSDYIELEASICNHGCQAPSGFLISYNPQTDVGYLLLVGNTNQSISQYPYNNKTSLIKVKNFVSNFVANSENNIFAPYANGCTILKYVNTSNYLSNFIQYSQIAAHGWINKQNFKLKIKLDEEYNLTVYLNNKEAFTYNIGENGGGTGLFAHCIAAFKDVKVTVKKEKIKEYKDVLLEPTWRNEAHHIVVNVDDKEDDSLTGKNTEGEILARTLDDKIHFIQWGTNTNKTETTNFINKNDGKGAFYDNNNYINCINETALYIKNLIDQTKESQYVIVEQKTNIDVLPTELKNNASSDDYPQGRWFIHHNYLYFDNNTGLSTQSEFYTPNLLCEFDKPGKYEIYFDDQLVKEIYAHRRPVAEFGMQVNGTSVSLNSESYDLDSNENIGYGKGIASESWYYKESNETTWHSGKLDTIDLEKTYIIKLEVTDKQGESNYTTKYIGSGIPVAAFNYASDTINQYNPLNVRNTSYDPKGLDIVSQEWILKKNGSTVGTYSSPLTDFSSLGTGNYTYTLTVTNSQGIRSEAYTKAFNVVDDNIEPSVIINPTNCDWKTGTQNVSVVFSDGESGFQKWRYAITDSQTKPSSGWSNYKTSSSDTITVTNTGIQYLHIEALDNAGNLLSRTVGTYKIDNEAPVINSIPVTVGNNSAEVKANAIDNHSGIDSYTLTGPSFNKTQKNDTFTVTLPGIYTLTVTDKVGNTSSKEVEVNVYYPITIVWKDENMPPELKPDTIILQAKDGDNITKEVELPNGTTDYTFKDLPINDDYTFDLIVSDRYDIEVIDQTIVVTYHASNFSVIIPKSITLNGITGTGSYLVKVSGEFFYNDALTVKPDTSFTLNDRSNISNMTGKVEQVKSVFTKDSLQNARGTISVNRTNFSGIWRGNYHFNVKFVMKN